jgi:Cu2+-containing amine oxidase
MFQRWKIFQSETFGFWLKPSNFYLENPAMDIYPVVSGTGSTEI